MISFHKCNQPRPPNEGVPILIAGIEPEGEAFIMEWNGFCYFKRKPRLCAEEICLIAPLAKAAWESKGYGTTTNQP